MLDPRVSLAAERTLLAWLRTGLGVIGLAAAGAHLIHVDGSVPVPLIVMLGVGVALPVLAAARYRRTMLRLNAGLELPPHDALLTMLVVVAVGLVAGAVALSLVLTRS